MGCGSSKSSDVPQVRTREAAPGPSASGVKPVPVATPHQTRGQNVPTSPRDKKIDMPPPGSSYTDRKEAEKDYFKDLVERASSKFIDIGDQPLFHDTLSFHEQVKIYDAYLSRLTLISEKCNFSVLPRASESCQKPMDMLQTSGISESDIEFLDKSFQSAFHATKSFSIHERGELVVPFPSIS